MQGLGTTTLITNFQNEHQAADLELEAILKEAKRKGQLAPGDVPPRRVVSRRHRKRPRPEENRPRTLESTLKS